MKKRKNNSNNCIHHRCFYRLTIVGTHEKRICIVYTRRRDRVFLIKLNAYAIHLFQEKRSVDDERYSATSCRNFRCVAATGKICMIYPSDNSITHITKKKIYIYNILQYSYLFVLKYEFYSTIRWIKHTRYSQVNYTYIDVTILKNYIIY